MSTWNNWWLVWRLRFRQWCHRRHLRTIWRAQQARRLFVADDLDR